MHPLYRLLREHAERTMRTVNALLLWFIVYLFWHEYMYCNVRWYGCINTLFHKCNLFNWAYLPLTYECAKYSINIKNLSLQYTFCFPWIRDDVQTWRAIFRSANRLVQNYTIRWKRWITYVLSFMGIELDESTCNISRISRPCMQSL